MELTEGSALKVNPPTLWATRLRIRGSCEIVISTQLNNMQVHCWTLVLHW